MVENVAVAAAAVEVNGEVEIRLTRKLRYWNMDVVSRPSMRRALKIQMKHVNNATSATHKPVDLIQVYGLDCGGARRGCSQSLLLLSCHM